MANQMGRRTYNNLLIIIRAYFFREFPNIRNRRADNWHLQHVPEARRPIAYKLQKQSLKCKIIMLLIDCHCCEKHLTLNSAKKKKQLIQAPICWMKHVKLASIILSQNFVSLERDFTILFFFKYESAHTGLSDKGLLREPRDVRDLWQFYFVDLYLSSVCSVTFHEHRHTYKKQQQWPYFTNSDRSEISHG